MNWITLEELLLIHEKVIEETGGVKGNVNYGAIESSLLRSFTAFDGKEMFPGLCDKIGALIHSIIAFHPFFDGNKRTALVAADVCLRLNGYRLVSSDVVEPFFWSIARGEQSLENIIVWLQNQIQPIDHYSFQTR